MIKEGTGVNNKASESANIDRLQFEAKLSEFIASQQSIPPDIANIVRKHFWDLIEDTRKQPTSDTGSLTEEDKARVWKQAEEHDKNLIDTYNWSGDMAQSFFDGAEYEHRHMAGKQAELIAENERLKDVELKLRDAYEYMKKCAENLERERDAIQSVMFTRVDVTQAAELDKLRTTQQWISVKDRLPEVGENVLLYFSEDDMAVASYHPTYQQWGRLVKEVWVIDNGDDISQTIELYRPTHWMPLPEPPKP